MPTGMNLGYVHAAYSAMGYVFGGPLEGVELTFVVLSSLDGVRAGVKAKQILLPMSVYADCYNEAYAACQTVQSGRCWNRGVYT